MSTFKILFLPKNLVVGAAFLLIFLLLFWLRSRRFSNRLLTESLGLNLLIYGVLFTMGEGYLMLLFVRLALASNGTLLLHCVLGSADEPRPVEPPRAIEP